MDIIKKFKNDIDATSIIIGNDLKSRFYHIWKTDISLESICVLLPRNTKQVSEIMKICYEIMIYNSINNEYTFIPKKYAIFLVKVILYVKNEQILVKSLTLLLNIISSNKAYHFIKIIIRNRTLTPSMYSIIMEVMKHYSVKKIIFIIKIHIFLRIFVFFYNNLA